MQAIEEASSQNFEAVMLLAAVGDAMGYKNGSWQFNYSSKLIHQQMMKITDNKGPLFLKIGMDWRYSDDTVMHLATAMALVNIKMDDTLQKICERIAIEYKKCSTKMSGRAPGKTCMKSLTIILEDGSNWNKIPYSDRRGGCGASMRSACIGLLYYKDIQKLIAVSIESGRITHHNPVGYLGAMISAYFTALAILKIKPHMWAAHLFSIAFPIAKKYVQSVQREVKLNIQSGQWQKFVTSWKQYTKTRNLSIILQKQSDPVFPQKYDIIERQHFYKSLSWTGWPGALGIDSVLIAYDALLSSKGSWQQLCLRGILHGGDNDSTGTIAGAWYGAYYGMKQVPKCHVRELEDNKKLSLLGCKLYQMTH